MSIICETAPPRVPGKSWDFQPRCVVDFAKWSEKIGKPASLGGIDSSVQLYAINRSMEMDCTISPLTYCVLLDRRELEGVTAAGAESLWAQFECRV